MFFSKSVAAASVLAAVANAQTLSIHSTSGVVATTTIAQAMPPSATAGFNAAAVNSTVRATWCAAQRNTCPQICGGFYSQNICNTDTLTYTCVCANGTVPDCTAFAITLPFYICQETFNQCEAAHPDDLTGKEACAAAEQCGSRNATGEALAATSASASSTKASSSGSSSGSATGAATGSATSSKASTSSTASANVGAYSNEVTTGAFMAVLMAAAGYLL